MLSFRQQLNKYDPDKIKQIASSTGFFDDSTVEISVNLAKDILKPNSYQKNNYNFILAEIDDKAVAYACFGRIPDSSSTYEIYWLSTLEDYRGLGIGRKLIDKVVDTVKDLGGSKLYIKTDGTEQYIPTRNFYEKYGFKLEAVLKEYYDDFDDCYIYAMKFANYAVNYLAAE